MYETPQPRQPLIYRYMYWRCSLYHELYLVGITKQMHNRWVILWKEESLSIHVLPRWAAIVTQWSPKISCQTANIESKKISFYREEHIGKNVNIDNLLLKFNHFWVPSKRSVICVQFFVTRFWRTWHCFKNALSCIYFKVSVFMYFYYLQGLV